MDELDSSPHPFVSAQLLKLFRDPATDPGGAQLVFSSHDATLLGRIQGEEVLHRDHIWFTEKNECGVTELFPIRRTVIARRWPDGCELLGVRPLPRNTALSANDFMISRKHTEHVGSTERF
ncbi:ATP/GTP-binding protein [Streptosporangium canum]|uniref:AAA family ATPase n=1 Tax=Streptosporangium canum TaxID=324952 RepID=UPI0036C7F24C